MLQHTESRPAKQRMLLVPFTTSINIKTVNTKCLHCESPVSDTDQKVGYPSLNVFLVLLRPFRQISGAYLN
jgi:hypothetical protein